MAGLLETLSPINTEKASIKAVAIENGYLFHWKRIIEYLVKALRPTFQRSGFCLSKLAVCHGKCSLNRTKLDWWNETVKIYAQWRTILNIDQIFVLDNIWMSWLFTLFCVLNYFDLAIPTVFLYDGYKFVHYLTWWSGVMGSEGTKNVFWKRFVLWVRCPPYR